MGFRTLIWISHSQNHRAISQLKHWPTRVTSLLLRYIYFCFKNDWGITSQAIFARLCCDWDTIYQLISTDFYKGLSNIQYYTRTPGVNLVCFASEVFHRITGQFSSRIYLSCVGHFYKAWYTYHWVMVTRTFLQIKLPGSRSRRQYHMTRPYQTGSDVVVLKTHKISIYTYFTSCCHTGIQSWQLRQMLVCRSEFALLRPDVYTGLAWFCCHVCVKLWPSFCDLLQCSLALCSKDKQWSGPCVLMSINVFVVAVWLQSIHHAKTTFILLTQLLCTEAINIFYVIKVWFRAMHRAQYDIYSINTDPVFWCQSTSFYFVSDRSRTVYHAQNDIYSMDTDPVFWCQSTSFSSLRPGPRLCIMLNTTFIL